MNSGSELLLIDEVWKGKGNTSKKPFINWLVTTSRVKNTNPIIITATINVEDSFSNASAFIYSLIESAKANDLEPKRYLKELFERYPLAVNDEVSGEILSLAGCLRSSPVPLHSMAMHMPSN